MGRRWAARGAAAVLAVLLSAPSAWADVAVAYAPAYGELTLTDMDARRVRIDERDDPPRVEIDLGASALAYEVDQRFDQGPVARLVAWQRGGRSGLIAYTREPLRGRWRFGSQGRLVAVTFAAPAIAPRPAASATPAPAARPATVAKPAPLHAPAPRAADVDWNHAMIRLAWTIGLTLSGVVGALMGVVLLLRLRLNQVQRRQRRFRAQFRPAMMAVMAGHDAAELPAMAPRDRLDLLMFWNHLVAAVRGEARDNLIRLGARLGLEAAAIGMLTSWSLRRRLIAMLTLGHLRAAEAWERLLPLAAEPSEAVSQTAMRALMLIDVDKALPVLVDQLTRRENWSPVHVAGMLFEAGFERVGPALAEATGRLPTREASRLLKFIVLMRSTAAGPAIRRLLETTDDPQVISLCLQTLQEPGDLALIRSYLAHPEWFVRVQAINALGRLGGEEDRALLVESLGDSQWWVRYRAAKSLATMPFVTMADLAVIGAEHADRYARDIVFHVIAEAVGT